METLQFPTLLLSPAFQEMSLNPSKPIKVKEKNWKEERELLPLIRNPTRRIPIIPPNTSGVGELYQRRRLKRRRIEELESSLLADLELWLLI